MKKSAFENATFLKSAYSLKECPVFETVHGQEHFEIAMVGRSNVGKSSLINHLLSNSKLAKVSSTPGKTQGINFFLIDDENYLVDLPGYGYAKVAKTLKEKWSQILDDYFQKRSSLSLILFLLDIRRDPSPDDAAFFSWAKFHQKPIVVVFTKCDKVKKSELAPLTKQMVDKLIALGASSPLSYVYTSIHDKQSRKVLIDKINQILEIT